MERIVAWLEGEDVSQRRSFEFLFLNIFKSVIVCIIFESLIISFLGDRLPNPKSYAGNSGRYFLYAVIFAPVVEEFLFRFLPASAISNIFYLFCPDKLTLNNLAVKRRQLWIFFIAGLLTSVIFGYIHGSVYNIFVQGVCGFCIWTVFMYYSKLGRYLRDGYLAAVLWHFLHNFIILGVGGLFTGP